MKKGFTLIEMAIVILVIGILMAATMRFGSGRITDLKAQSLKEQFVGWYNELYSQNMTSSFRDGKKYQQLTIVFTTWAYYLVDKLPIPLDSTLSDIRIQNMRFDQESVLVSVASLSFVPYSLWCTITTAATTGAVLYFDLFVPENGKQYCFEIKAETCKLIETRCID